MSTITIRSYSDEDMTHNLNVCKDEVLYFLVREGVITLEQATPYLRDHHVMVKSPSRVSRLLGCLFGKAAREDRLVIVKQMNLRPPETPKAPAESVDAEPVPDK